MARLRFQLAGARWAQRRSAARWSSRARSSSAAARGARADVVDERREHLAVDADGVRREVRAGEEALDGVAQRQALGGGEGGYGREPVSLSGRDGGRGARVRWARASACGRLENILCCSRPRHRQATGQEGNTQSSHALASALATTADTVTQHARPRILRPIVRSRGDNECFELADGLNEVSAARRPVSQGIWTTAGLSTVRECSSRRQSRGDDRLRASARDGCRWVATCNAPRKSRLYDAGDMSRGAAGLTHRVRVGEMVILVLKAGLLAPLKAADPADGAVPVLVGDLDKLHRDDIPAGIAIEPCSKIEGATRWPALGDVYLVHA